jgi:proteic killer suppression protein
MFHRDDLSRIHAPLRERVCDVLTALDSADSSLDLNLPGFRLHRLKGRLEGFWLITVSGNWRIILRFQQGDVHDVDLVDYH